MTGPFLISLPWILLVAALAAGGWLRRRYQLELEAHRRSSDELAHTQAMLRRISQAVESTSDAIGIGDMTGHSLYHNHAHVQLFGYTVDELNAVPESGVLFADTRIAREILESVKAGRSWRGETDIRTKAGRRVPAFVRADIIRDEQGRPVGIYGVFADITEERKRRDAVVRAGKLESLGLLAGGIAHDFNNLLAIIGGNVQLVQQQPGHSDFTVKRLQEVDRIVWRARDLTQGLKTFAKGGTPIKIPTQLTGLIRESAGLAIKDSSVELDDRLPEGLRRIEADESQLGQVLHNIMLNAVQAMPTGGRITVTAANLALGDDPAIREGEQWVRVSIADNGPGMSPEVLARIFDPFFTTKAKGTGLGLATSYSIVEQHNGQLRVESTVGLGTVFHLYLPAIRDGNIVAFPARTG
jgi:PAS domain S-box-containing protein